MYSPAGLLQTPYFFYILILVLNTLHKQEGVFVSFLGSAASRACVNMVPADPVFGSLFIILLPSSGWLRHVPV